MHHVGIVVRDLQESISFYRDTLGFEVMVEFTITGSGFATAIGIDDVTGQFAHLDGGTTRIELIQYDSADTGDEMKPLTEPGAKHIAFTVADIETMYDNLPEETSCVSPPQQIETGTTVLFLRDPDGNFLEIVQSA